MRKSFWLFAIVLSMSLGIRAQAAPREIPDRFNTGVDTDTELTEIPEPGIYGGIQYKTGAGGQLALDLVYSNRQAGNEIEIRNMDCVECRCCQYICSSKIPIIDSIKAGKNAVRGMK